MIFFRNIFGGSGQGRGKKFISDVSNISALETELRQRSLQELAQKTKTFQQSLVTGQSLNDILPEAFAVVREASVRTLRQRHFDVQLMGGVALNAGKIAEMKTGEGKTLTATLAVYLNALDGKGVHVVTVNDYLARRDAIWMGQIYYALGLSVGCITHNASYIYDPSYGGKSEIQNPKSETNPNEQNSKRDEQRDTLGSFKIEDSY